MSNSPWDNTIDNNFVIPEIKVIPTNFTLLGCKFTAILNFEYIKPFELFIKTINASKLASWTLWEDSKLTLVKSCHSDSNSTRIGIAKVSPDWVIRNILGLSDTFNKMEEIYKVQCAIDDRNSKIDDIIKD